jgi:DNA-binding response OmpR family regulator
VTAPANLHVVLIDPTARARTPEMAVLRAAGMEVQLVTSVVAPVAAASVDAVVADLRARDTWPGAVLRLAFEFDRPVVVISDLDQVDARLAALRYGATDHVVAPTEARELIERVRQAAARARSVRDGMATQLLVDRPARVARNGSRSIALTPVELAVLEVLLERSGEVVSKEEISEALPNRPRPNTVEVHVSALRRKLGAIGAPTVKTVHRRGYVLRSSLPVAPTTVRVADLVAQRTRLVRERDDAVRRRDEILPRHAGRLDGDGEPAGAPEGPPRSRGRPTIPRGERDDRSG